MHSVRSSRLESVNAMKHILGRYGLFSVVRAGIYFTVYGLVKYLPAPLFDPARALILKIFARRIETMRIKDGVTIWFPEGVEIGRNVSINEWCFLDGYGGLEIGDWARIAHGCSIISEDHDFSDPDRPIYMQDKIKGRVTIGKDVWLGAGVRVMKGVTIGDGSVIGAGSVVTKNIPEYSVAVGNPARVIRSRRGD